MRSTIAAVLVGAGTLIAPDSAPAQSLGFSEINWCKWQNPPEGELRAAIGEMERQLEQIEKAIDLMAMAEGFAGGGDQGPRDFGELAVQIEAMRAYARLGHLYDHRHQILNCLHNKLDELEARNEIRRGPPGPRRQVGTLKDKAQKLKLRRDRLGPAHDAIEAAPDGDGGYRITTSRRVLLYRNRMLRHAPGGPAASPGGPELELGLAHRWQWNPDFRMGAGGAARRFDTETRTFVPRLELRVPLRGLWNRPTWLGIGAEGGTSDHKRGAPDLAGAGQIFSIDGTNAQTITAARSAQLDLHHDTVAINAYIASRLASWGGGESGYVAFAGFQYVRDRWTYDFSQLVSGGGAFFAHAVRSDVASDFYGARFGGSLIQRIAGNAVWTVTGHVTPGYQRSRMTAFQFPGTFGAGSVEVRESRGDFALRTGVSTTIEMEAGPALHIGGTAGYEHLSRLPFVDGLFRGRAGLGHGSANSLIVMIRARIVLD